VNIFSTSLGGLDLLASAVLVLDVQGRITFANAAAESLLESSFKLLHNQRMADLFVNGDKLATIFAQAQQHQFYEKREDLFLERAGGRLPLQVNMIVTILGDPENPLLIELRENDQQIKLDREERLLDQTQANKELIRNLAHEIKIH